MRSYDRGSSFEDVVEDQLRRALAASRLGLLPDSATVYRHKKYFSKDRNDFIIVDVSIEVILPGASTWSLLWAWECKNYQHSVGVSEIEEFYSKLLQIGGANIKGGFASAGPLQRSALEYAKSKGIAVLRIRPEEEIHWVSYSRYDEPRPRTLEEICEGEITSLDKIVHNTVPDHGVSTQGGFHRSIMSLVEEEVENSINATPHPSSELLGDEAAVVEQLARSFGNRPWKLNERPICCSYVEKVFGLPPNSAEVLIPRAVERFRLFLDQLEGDKLILKRKE